MNNFGIFITVRTNSSRFPQKTLQKINGRRVIEHDIDRAKLVQGAQRVVVCTSTDPSDDVLEEITKQNGVEFFRGSREDKLARWRDAAERFHVDYFVEYDGDDIFCDPELMDLAITQMKEWPCDVIVIPPKAIIGGSAFCIAASAVRRAADLETEPADNWIPYFTETDLFDICELHLHDPLFYNQKIRLTLDYPEDFEFFQKTFHEMKMTRNIVPLREIIVFLNKRPDLVAINWFRQKDYLENQKRMTKLVRKRP